tara:strand:- start:5716 stop:6297 length:582 start_codon:yes stop_codon:yes gene_type:complete
MPAPTLTPSSAAARTAPSVDILANKTLQSLERLYSNETSNLGDFENCLHDVVTLLKASHENAHFIAAQFKEVLFTWSTRREETKPLDAFQGFLVIARMGNVDSYDALKVLQAEYETKLDRLTKQVIAELDALYKDYLEERCRVTQEMLEMFRTELNETGATWQSDRVNQQKQIELQEHAVRLERKILFRFINN